MVNPLACLVSVRPSRQKDLECAKSATKRNAKTLEISKFLESNINIHKWHKRNGVRKGWSHDSCNSEWSGPRGKGCKGISWKITLGPIWRLLCHHSNRQSCGASTIWHQLNGPANQVIYPPVNWKATMFNRQIIYRLAVPFSIACSNDQGSSAPKSTWRATRQGAKLDQTRICGGWNETSPWCPAGVWSKRAAVCSWQHLVQMDRLLKIRCQLWEEGKHRFRVACSNHHPKNKWKVKKRIFKNTSQGSSWLMHPFHPILSLASPCSFVPIPGCGSCCTASSLLTPWSLLYQFVCLCMHPCTDTCIYIYIYISSRLPSESPKKLQLHVTHLI